MSLSSFKMNVSDVRTFSQKSTRGNNDSTNKVRERVLLHLYTLPQSYPDYLDHPEYGPEWCSLYQSWHDAIKTMAIKTGVPEYTSVDFVLKAGLRNHYDLDVFYGTLSGPLCRKMEFKYGTTQIAKLPQILSLFASYPLFDETYDTFWYDRYLDRYIACDPGITVIKPVRDLYLKQVTNFQHKNKPFFEQLRVREPHFKAEKKKVVDDSIADFLDTYGAKANLALLADKLSASQDKNYLLCEKGVFHLERVANEILPLTYLGIKNKNTIQVMRGTTLYNLLLRWRNRKGILVPAWQISVKP